MRRHLLTLLVLLFAFSASLCAQPLQPELQWPKTAFAAGIALPAMPAAGAATHTAAAPAIPACGSSTCTSPYDIVCGQCSIACPLGKASVCQPGTRVTETTGKESCGQRPACSCN